MNFECGANQTNYHNINVNFGRDLPRPEMGDFKQAKEGDGCPRCGGKLQAARGIEVGHIFKLGTKYSKAMNCSYLDQNGKTQPVIMGCYGIGVSRMAAAWIEQNHDEKGILWSKQIAPYQAHLIGLNLEEATVKEQVEKIYGVLRQNKIEVLYDDRPLRAGEKFSDAELIGIPVRLTVSKRTLEKNQVEFKLRAGGNAEMLSIDEVVKRLQEPS